MKGVSYKITIFSDTSCPRVANVVPYQNNIQALISFKIQKSKNGSSLYISYIVGTPLLICLRLFLLFFKVFIFIVDWQIESFLYGTIM